MHLATLHLAPIIGAEKSKVPFYVAGGALVAWALFVSLGLGLRRPDFPGSARGQRAVIAISAVLVLAALSTAVITSGTSPKAEAAGGPKKAAPATGAGTSQVALAADPSGQLRYNTTNLSATAGKVTITMTNMSPIEHNVTVAQGTAVVGATPTFVGGSRTLTVNLQPGTYNFYCSVPGHRQAGMQGTISVS